MIWTGHVTHMGEMRNLYKTLVRKPETKRPLGRTRHRWEDNTENKVERVWTEFIWLRVMTNCGLL
jgi:hypothetical protein